MFYSFVVQCKEEIVIPEYLVTLDQGVNVFNVVVKDLDGFLRQLQEAGVMVQQVHRLEEEAFHRLEEETPEYRLPDGTS